MRLLAFCFLLKQPPLCTAANTLHAYFARLKPFDSKALNALNTLHAPENLKSTVQPFHNLLRSCKNMKRPEPNPNPNR